MRDPKTILFAVIAVAIASSWCGASAARTGLAPVVAEGGFGLKMAQKVERAALRALTIQGVNPPKPATLAPHLGLASSTDPPSTAQCVAAGEALGLDVVVVIRVRQSAAGDAESELRVVVVETGKEYLYHVRSPASLAPSEVRALVYDVFGPIRIWEGDLIDVEHALGRDMDRLYARFMARGRQTGSFAEYMYNRAERRKHVSLALAITLPTLIAGATVAFGVGTRGIWIDEESDNVDDCFTCGIGDILIVVARVAVVLGIVIGTGGAIASGVGGHLAYSDRKKEMTRLRPLLAEPPPVSWHVAPYASPEGGGLALDLRF